MPVSFERRIVKPEASIHVHEDDYGMRVLVPAAALADVQRDQANAKEHHARHTDQNGLTTKPYAIRRPSLDYSAIPLRVTDAAAALEKHFPRVRKFTATATSGFEPRKIDAYGSYETDAYCFGASAECFIKLEDKDHIVREIWFECLTSDREEIARFRAALNALNIIAPSAIADYWFNECGAISDQEFMDRYCRALLQGAD